MIRIVFLILTGAFALEKQLNFLY